MTNLRWIESEIDRLIFSIEQLKKLNKNGDVTIQEKRLTHLNQIKTILEAWEEIQKYLILSEGYIPFYGSTYEYLTLKNDCIDESNSTEECESLTIIKKGIVHKND